MLEKVAKEQILIMVDSYEDLKTNSSNEKRDLDHLCCEKQIRKIANPF